MPRGSDEDQAAVRRRLMRLSDEPATAAAPVTATGRAAVPSVALPREAARSGGGDPPAGDARPVASDARPVAGWAVARGLASARPQAADADPIWPEPPDAASLAAGQPFLGSGRPDAISTPGDLAESRRGVSERGGGGPEAVRRGSGGGPGSQGHGIALRDDAGVTNHSGRTLRDDEAGRPSRAGGGSAFDPGRRGVRALAAVAAVVVLVAAAIAWYSRPHAEPVATDPVPAASGDAPPDRAASPSAGGEVVVAVGGRVRKPGLVRLPEGARVADALTAAGGVLPGTDVALLNLARKVTDGELILVGVTAPPGAGGPAGGAAPEGAAGGKVNLNTATLAQLDALPGVGPVLAQRILDHREKNGPFRTVSDLRQVDGIGDTRYEQLKELVTV